MSASVPKKKGPQGRRRVRLTNRATSRERICAVDFLIMSAFSLEHFLASALFIPDLFPDDLILSFVLVGKLELDQDYLLTLHVLLHHILALGGRWLFPRAAHLPGQPALLLKESLSYRSAAAHWCQHGISASILAMPVTGQRPVLLTVTALNPGPLAIFVSWHFPGIRNGYSLSLLFFPEVQAPSSCQQQAMGCCLWFPQHCSSHTSVLVACGHKLGACQGFPTNLKWTWQNLYMEIVCFILRPSLKFAA